jgi:iron complex transport system substrate-binding protein
MNRIPLHAGPISAAFALAILLAGCGRSTPVAGRDGTPRVISLAPSLTEIICAIDGQDMLVGRTSVCKYPPDVLEKIPVVGGFGTPSLEVLLSLKPTLILEVDLDDKTVAQKIDQLGMNRKRIPCHTLDDIPAAMRAIGRHIGRQDKADQMADRMDARLAELRAIDPGTNPPSVFVEIWNDPLTTVGKSGYISSLIQLAGGRNIGDTVTNQEYYVVSSEWVVTQDPDIIIVLAMGNPATVVNSVASRTGWSQVKAVRHRRVYLSANSETLTIPGPRVLDGIEEIRRFIQSPAPPATTATGE